jgi:hypothetical protein
VRNQNNVLMVLKTIDTMVFGFLTGLTGLTKPFPPPRERTIPGIECGLE